MGKDLRQAIMGSFALPSELPFYLFMCSQCWYSGQEQR